MRLRFSTTWPRQSTGFTSIALTGYAFACEFRSLLELFEKASWAIAAAVPGIGYFLWRRAKKQALGRQCTPQDSAAA